MEYVCILILIVVNSCRKNTRRKKHIPVNCHAKLQFEMVQPLNLIYNILTYQIAEMN